LPEPEIRSLESERAALQDTRARLGRDRERAKEEADQERGSIRGSLAELPQRILARERDVAACRADLARMERARKAAAIARDLFAEIARDSDVLMEQLAAEIASTYGDLVGGPRAVRLAAFDLQTARAVDAGGTQRSLDALSSGTRDLFLLAARLALAARSRSGRALIVLDEPFQAIDDDRAGRALSLLRRFQQQRDWQILLLSKDDAAAALLRSVFPEAEVHRLSRGHARDGARGGPQGSGV
jgi:DNA repair exonuclease SbcCD ATPase subunit